MTSSSLSDQELVRRLQEGDESAFERVYDVYYTRLWRFARSFVRQREVAQEIVHDTFLALWTGRAAVQVRTSLESYLYGAVRNHALKAIRRYRLSEQFVGAPASEASSGSASDAPNSDPLSRLEEEERNALLVEAVRLLTERQRTAILLRWRHGMRYDEIAAVLDVSPQAARTFVLRVQALLRQMIEGR